MAITARISSGYKKKLLFTGLFLSAFGLWAVYDVFIKYPPQYERWQSYVQFREDGNLEAWPAHATSLGWPEEEPTVREKGHFYYNYAFMLLLPIGLIYAGSSLAASKRWIKADDDGLSTHKGQQVPFAAITEMNEKRWDDKGIAVVFYNNPQGIRQRLVLDEFNYETQPIRDMHAKVKALLNPGQAAEQAAEQDQPAGNVADADNANEDNVSADDKTA